jgi:TetR/AcrR family transcriptional regulator, mexJK operon transcriptional repressor
MGPMVARNNALSAGVGARARATKRDLILDTARELFLAHGFEGTSIDQIAEAAAVSRQTIYNNFDGKEALFRALTGRLVDHLVEPLVSRDPESDDVARTLTDLAERMLSVAMLPSSLALYRLVVTEAPKFPDVARQIYETGAERAAKALGAYLAAQSARGILAVDDPQLAAEHFFGMLVGHRQYRALLGVAEPVAHSVESRAARTVRAFLRAYGA